MNIELKNIKYSAFASHETHCFQATLYVDGKRTATVSNDGNGGCDLVEPISVKGGSILDRDPKAIARLKAVDEYLKEHGNHSTYGDGEVLHEDLEMRCCTLVNQWHQDNEVKKLLRRITYIKGDGVYQLPAKYKPNPANLAQVMRAKWWDMKYVMLSGLSLAEARTELDRIGYFGGAA